MRLRFSLTTLLILLVASAAGAFLGRHWQKPELAPDEMFMDIVSWDLERGTVLARSEDDLLSEWVLVPEAGKAEYLGEVHYPVPIENHYRISARDAIWQFGNHIYRAPPRQGAPIQCALKLDFSPVQSEANLNGLAFVGTDRHLRCFDWNGQLLGPVIDLNAHDKRVDLNFYHRLSLSHNTQWLILKGYYFWHAFHIPTGKLVALITRSSDSSWPDELRDSKILMGTDEGECVALDVATSEALWRIQLEGMPLDFIYSPCGRYVLMHMDNAGQQRLHLLDLHNEGCEYWVRDSIPQHLRDWADIRFSPDGEYLIVLQDLVPYLIETRTGRTIELRFVHHFDNNSWLAVGILIACGTLLAYQVLRWMRSTPKSLSRHDHPHP